MQPFTAFIFKIASRCNLDCDYCFMYNLGDNSWKRQPKFMSLTTFRSSCIRIREHCENNNIKKTSIIMHGGEPMLIGTDNLREYKKIVNEEIDNYGIISELGMQTNGTIFSEEIGNFFSEIGMTFGVSLDGPAHVNDIHRKDHKGKGSSEIIEKNLKIITSDKYKKQFKGFLCVINPESDPVQVLDYFFSYKPEMIDLLIPDDNFERLPVGKELSLMNIKLGNWLAKAFDHWYNSETNTSIRYFENIIKLILGGYSNIETIGTSPADFIIVETNGDIELLDSLKGSFEGATKIGKNVFDHSFDEVANFYEVRSRQVGVESLCMTCKKCNIVNICGGGYLPHRYSKNNNYDNPSVYCEDLKFIIRHIYNTISKELV